MFVALAVTALTPTPAAQAAPGDLDPSFDGDGKLTTGFVVPGTDTGTAVALQPDGKIVVAGSSGDFALARYNPDGSLDTTFSGDGKQSTDFGGSDGANAVALQADGKIVVAGSSGGNFALARYNPDGSLDTTFSGDGKQTTDGLGEAKAVTLQPDGKIVAAGGGFALARYNADGSLDTSFSEDGKQTTNFGTSAYATAVALQPDGKIVLAGFTHQYFPPTTVLRDFALARYNADGSLDTDFSDDGKQTTDVNAVDEANAVALQGDGKIVLAGSTIDDLVYGDDNFLLARYNSDGSLDTSFSGDGVQTTDFGIFSHRAKGVTLQADGKIVVAGSSGGNFALARYNPDGSLDTGFSEDGMQTTDFGGSAGANAVALQSDSKIVATGFGAGDFALARYSADGSLDTSFSGDGKQTTDLGATTPVSDEANAVAIQPDAKIVAAGDTGGGDDFALVRYNADGSLDTGFSEDGMQTTDFGGADPANAVALQPDGKIVVAGGTWGGDSDFLLARYNADGSLDTSFDGDGKQTTDFGGTEGANAVALQPDGKIVVAGRATSVPGPDGFAVARYNPDGSLDTSFDGDGKLTTDPDLGEGMSDAANAVAIQPDGKIVAVGGDGAGAGDFAVARYNPDGSLDTGFSGDGMQTTDFGTSIDQANAVAIQPDAKIVAAGQAPDFAVARYNADGSLDTDFSGDGKQTTDFGGVYDTANAVALQPDGKIVAVGHTGTNDSGGDFVLARYNPDGSLDTTFSGDGKQTTDFGGSSDGGNAVALQGDGKIVAAGRTGSGYYGPFDFALARYERGPLDINPFGNVLQLDGIDDYANVADNPTLDLGDTDGEDFTIESFFYVSNETNDSNDTIFYKQNAYALFINFNTASADAVFFRWWTGPLSGDFVSLFNTTDISVGWHHIAAVYDNEYTASNDRVGIYLDGAQLADNSGATDLTPGIWNSTSALGVGAGNALNHVEGSLDEARISDSVRYSGSYAIPPAPFSADANTRALWHFDDACTSTSFADSSPNDNTLTGQNGAQAVPPGGTPCAPTLTGTDPVSPANDNNPKVQGTAGYGAPTDIKIYKNQTCSGSPDATGTIAAFTGAGIPVSVADDTTTDLSAEATNANGDSTCSNSIAYNEDSSAPSAPTITDTDPDSPANDNSPEVKGSAEAGSTVRLYSGADCSGAVLASGPAASFASPGLTPSPAIPGDATTAFRATATDAAGNVSPCSAGLSYSEDSNAPDTTIDSGPAGGATTNDSTPSFGFSSNEPGSTFQCKVDSGSFGSCTSPHTTATLADGSHTFEVWATDPAGNTDGSPASRTFTVDTTPPQIPAPSLTPSGTPTPPGASEECNVAKAKVRAAKKRLKKARTASAKMKAKKRLKKAKRRERAICHA